MQKVNVYRIFIVRTAETTIIHGEAQEFSSREAQLHLLDYVVELGSLDPQVIYQLKSIKLLELAALKLLLQLLHELVPVVCFEAVPFNCEELGFCLAISG